MPPIAVDSISSFHSVESSTKNPYPKNAILSDDVESQLSSTTIHHDATWKASNVGTSPITYKSPGRTRTKHVVCASPSTSSRKRDTRTSSNNAIPRELPLGITTKSFKQLHQNETMMDRVLDSVESTPCQLHPEPEISVAMKKRVMIDEAQNVRVSPTHATLACTTIPTNATSPRAKSPRSILKRSRRFGLRPNTKKLGADTSTPSDPTTPTTAFVEPTGILYKEDLLDYVFDSVESFLCRHDNHDKGLGKTNKVLDGDIPNSKSPDQLERLYKVPSVDKGDIVHTKPKDTLDYIFECGATDNDDEELRIYPTPAKDRDVLDYMFECGGETMELADSRDASFRTPQSPHGHGSALALKIPKRDDNSIILNPSSSSLNDSYRIGRAEILRQKKRQIEEKRKLLVIRGQQKRYLIPKGCEDDSVTRSMIISQVSSDALSRAEVEKDRSRRIRQVIMAVFVITVVGLVLVVFAVSFFFPFRAP